jgi:hypothetical protein
MTETTLQQLAARVQQLEDEREIRYVLSRYGHYCDIGGYEDHWADQWTPDGVYDLVTVKRQGAGYDGAARFEGRAALLGMLHDPNAHQKFVNRCMHVQDINLVIQIKDDDATAEGYSMTLLKEGNDIAIRTAGMVRWTFRRIDGKWRIVEKRRRPVGDAELFAGMEKVPAHAAARGES